MIAALKASWPTTTITVFDPDFAWREGLALDFFTARPALFLPRGHRVIEDC